MWYSFPGAENWIPLEVTTVKEYSEMNRNGKKTGPAVHDHRDRRSTKAYFTRLRKCGRTGFFDPPRR